MVYRRRDFAWGVFAVIACAFCVLVAGGCEDKMTGGNGDEPVTLLVDSTPPAKVERPAWMDAETLIFSWDQGTQNTQLWTRSLKGSQPIRFISDNPRKYLNPSYSSGLGIVAFEVLDDPSSFEGSNIDAAFRSNPLVKTRLVSQAESGSATFPTWGPGGTTLGFMVTIEKTSYFVTQGVEIYQGIIRKTGDPAARDFGQGVQASRMVWHGPSNRVAYNRVPPSAQTGTEIYYYDMGSGAFVHLTDKDTEDGSGDENPSWSPDGNYIVYSSFHSVDFRHELYIVSVQTKAVSRITTTGSDESDPAWSPDGTRIAYVSDGDLYVMTLDQSRLPQ